MSSEQEVESQQQEKEGQAIKVADQGVDWHEEAGVVPGASQSCALIVNLQSDQVDEDQVAHLEGQEAEPQKGVEREPVDVPGGDEKAQAVNGSKKPGEERWVFYPKIPEGVKAIVG
jgi:hypothetical protein